MFKAAPPLFPSRLPATPLWRPEQMVAKPRRWYERWVHAINGRWQRWRWQHYSPVNRYLAAINAMDESLRASSDEQLQQQLTELRQTVLRRGYCEQTLPQAFALIREFSGRVSGMRHFNSQLRGGLVMFLGCVAEMATGEGKTLTATLPAAAAALAGIPVHVITVNDYLAHRDADEMRPLYARLGLSLGCIQQGMSPDQRRSIYACDIVYCTNKELVFDYLKDHLILKHSTNSSYRHAERLKGNQRFDSELMLRGLHFAIIDEADSVCMDEARTPLIISGAIQSNEAQDQVYREAVAIARQLQRDRDYIQNDMARSLRLTERGETLIDDLSAELGPYWVGRVRRHEVVRQALTALNFFELDRHYLLRDGKVQIIDEHTGRVMADRTWERGLHQLIETKEGCEITAPRETLAKISYQKFFRRYHWLSGMTGTAKEVISEFWNIYEMPVVQIATHHPLRRRNLGDTLCQSQAEKLDAIAQAARREVERGRSVLVGTATVGASELIAVQLARWGVDHCVLNAKQDEAEADFIAQAGHRGRVTIATSMAGRGTDIKLQPEVKEAGGLHVILTELQEASRIDRQLAGRCARFGDPGSTELIVAIDDRWLGQAWYKGLLSSIRGSARGERLVLWLMRSAQARLERRHGRMRHQLLQADEREGEVLAFTAANL